MPKRRQAIIWTNADPIHCHIYAVLVGDELNRKKLLNSLKNVPGCPVNNKSLLVQTMAWCRTGAKPLSEPNDGLVYWRIPTWLGLRAFNWLLRTKHHHTSHLHYNDVIMGAISSQITSPTVVFSTVYSDANQRKHQSSASLAFVWGIHRGSVNSPHKWPVTRKMFPFDDVIMELRTIDPIEEPPGSSYKHTFWVVYNTY